MDLEILRRALACLEPAADAGRDLDASLSRLLGVLAGMPGLASAAVVLADADNPPAIRAQIGAPDVSLLLEAALERPIVRQATQPTRGSQARRLEAKRATSARKQARRGGWD